MGLLDSILSQALSANGQQPQQSGNGGLEGLGSLAGLGSLDAMLGGSRGGAGAAPEGMGSGGLADVLGGLLANDGQAGGLGGLVSKFEQAGLGDVIGSWVGNGENQQITPDQMHGALGSDTINSMASRLGINAQTLLPLLASLLPVLINQFTPQGRVPDRGLGNQDDLLASLGSLFNRG
ncbi:YidB family protein [Variovorax dokdonensis]|uniref:YidB family protein n=1 Tax=Variovorax dokdonensis TaxID=344883 RepID=A0ABT7N9E1_9BURK|nr:YidB family protein [Variovorax dokdonensis]MDM0044567.1 YidB family protein [Variovorax dokdonensis]